MAREGLKNRHRPIQAGKRRFRTVFAVQGIRGAVPVRLSQVPVSGAWTIGNSCKLVLLPANHPFCTPISPFLNSVAMLCR